MGLTDVYTLSMFESDRRRGLTWIWRNLVVESNATRWGWEEGESGGWGMEENL